MYQSFYTKKYFLQYTNKQNFLKKVATIVSKKKNRKLLPQKNIKKMDAHNP